MYNIQFLHSQFLSRPNTFNWISRHLKCRLRHKYSTNAISLQPALTKTIQLPEFNILHVNNHGKQKHYVISKTLLCNELGFTMRDLRFQHSHFLHVRNQKIVIRFQILKAVVCRNSIFFIDFSSDDRKTKNDIKRFLDELPVLFTGCELNSSNLPFEYKAVEAILAFTISKFSETLAELEPDINIILKALTDPTNLVVDRSLVHILLQKSRKLNEFGTILQEFTEAIEEWLDDDDDLQDLCISVDSRNKESRSSYDAHVFYKPQKEEDENLIRFDKRINLQDEMELLLESFLKNAEEMRNRVGELKSSIESSNNTILINLDSHRNLLLRLEIQLTIGMFSCGVFSMIGMAFGMNLTSHLEEHPLAFWIATGTMAGGSIILWRILLKYLDRAPRSKQSNLLKSLTSREDEFGTHNNLDKVVNRHEINSKKGVIVKKVLEKKDTDQR